MITRRRCALTTTRPARSALRSCHMMSKSPAQTRSSNRVLRNWTETKSCCNPILLKGDSWATVVLKFTAKAVGVSPLTLSTAGVVDDTMISRYLQTNLNKGEVFVGVTPTAIPTWGASATQKPTAFITSTPVPSRPTAEPNTTSTVLLGPGVESPTPS